MARNRRMSFRTLFSPSQRSERTKRWRKRFPRFSFSPWQSTRIVENVCGWFRATAAASRAVRMATGSQVIGVGYGRSLRLEGLEDRRLLAADVWVNDNWALIADNGALGVVDVGDVVRNDNDTLAP